MHETVLRQRIQKGLKIGKDSYIHGYIEKFHPEWITIGEKVIFGDEGRIITHGPIKPYAENPRINIEDSPYRMVKEGVLYEKCARELC